MSFKEIQEHRKEGRIEQALEMATQALESDPQNIWNKRAAAWVYYDLIKKYSDLEHYELFKENLVKLKELALPENEKMVFDNAAWQIGSVVFALQKAEPFDYGRINELLEIINDFHFTKPSDSYSFIYKAFHKGYKNWSRYLEFADWWDLKNFQPEDYLNGEFNGRKIMSVGEQACIAYSKKLLEVLENDQDEVLRKEIKEKAKSFIPIIDKIIDSHPEYQYPPYFKAKLLLALGSDQNILSEFLPFAKQKRNDFWVWELIAEILPDEDPRIFHCYCKALSLNTPEDFLIKLREKFAEILIEKGLLNEAKTEIQKILEVRQDHHWRISHRISNWTQSDWYQTTASLENNQKLYKEHARKAEEILFDDIPEELVAVEFVNKNKNMVHFVIDRQTHGFFKYPKHLNPKIGDLLNVKFDQKEANGFHKTFTIKNSEDGVLPSAIKDFEGVISIRPGNSFGFVDDIFLDPEVVEDNDLIDGQSLKGKAILSYNKKKDDWGWKCFSIIS